MSFSEKIKQLRTKAQESQAANKIIDMLKALDSNNDANTAYRWIWELIQNAKDVPNSSGKVDIEISFDASKKTLEFRHNGRLFSTKNIIFLIEQVSTKERDKIEHKKEKSTGKFGTGFLTTHLLSKKVTVSGYIQDDDEPISKFSIDLDRTSGLQREIIASIENSCNQLENNSFHAEASIDENAFNTCFTYYLNDLGINVAKEGINNLIVSAPFVFAFVPEINTITIIEGSNTKKIERRVERPIKLDNSRVISTSITTNGQKENRYIAVLQNFESGVEIAVEVEQKQCEKWLCEINEKLSFINNKDVCPTQNGNFRCISELYIDSGEIAEETKDVLNLIGRDVREELINKKINLKPARPRRRTNEEIATPLINYIEKNQKNLGNNNEEKTIFQSFYRYLREHECDENIKKVFALLYSNLHWFYNDKDIAANM